MNMINRRAFLGTALAGAAAAQQRGGGPTPRRPSRIVKLFKSPDGYPNALETTPEGLWIGEQVSERACLVDWSGKLIRKFDTESHNTSGIAAGGGYVWMAANGRAVGRDLRPGESTGTEIVQCDSRTGKIVRKWTPVWPGGMHGMAWNPKTNTLWVTALGLNALAELDPKDNFRILRQIPVRLSRAHGLDFDGDAIWCLFSNDLQIQKLDMQTGRVMDIVQLTKDDPDPHGMCMHQGKLHYSDAGIAPGGGPSGSPNAGYVFRIEM
jgi:hypothetical protein